MTSYMKKRWVPVVVPYQVFYLQMNLEGMLMLDAVFFLRSQVMWTFYNHGEEMALTIDNLMAGLELLFWKSLAFYIFNMKTRELVDVF